MPFLRHSLPILIGVTLGAGIQDIVFASNSPVSDEVVALAQQCAPSVDPMTMAYIVAHESSNRQFAVNVNYGGPQLARQPTNHAEALSAIVDLEREGYNYDLGMAQINSANFEWLGVSAEDLLDPCRNLKASERVIHDCYGRAISLTNDTQEALRMALSCYNTGSFERGFTNGYVNRLELVASQATQLRVPRLLLENDPHDNTVTYRQSDKIIENTSAQKAGERVSSSNNKPDAFGTALPDAFGRKATDAFLSQEANRE